jgi:hypothetical protein
LARAGFVDVRDVFVDAREVKEKKMQFVVRVEPNNGRGFLARSPLAPDLTAEAPTADQAVADLQQQLSRLVSSGGLRAIEVPLVSNETKSFINPWQEVAGLFKDDPLFDEVLEHMKVYREQRNQEMDEVGE